MRTVKTLPIPLFLLLFVLPVPVWGQGVFITQHAVISYNQASELVEMSHRLHFTPDEKVQENPPLVPDPGQAVVAPELAAKIDGLFNKVCKILNQRPPKPQRLRLVLLPDSKQVQQRRLACQPALQGQAIFGYHWLPAFYEAPTHTIFLSLADLRNGIMVHEMTHFVLCEAFAVPPPPELQEQWAQYVEISCE